MYNLKQDEFNELLRQHQVYVNSLNEYGVKIQINKCDLIKLEIKNISLTDSFITESRFQDNHFENIEIFDANLCGCKFDHVTFLNVNFVKTDLSYCLFRNCKFINTKLKRCETTDSSFEYTQFISCDLYDSFSYSSLKKVLFCDMSLKNLDFYKTIISNIKLKNVEENKKKKSIISLNIGDFKNENIIVGEEAIEYFQKNCIYE